MNRSGTSTVSDDQRRGAEAHGTPGDGARRLQPTEESGLERQQCHAAAADGVYSIFTSGLESRERQLSLRLSSQPSHIPPGGGSFELALSRTSTPVRVLHWNQGAQDHLLLDAALSAPCRATEASGSGGGHLCAIRGWAAGSFRIQIPRRRYGLYLI